MGIRKALFLICLSTWCQFDDVLLANFSLVQSSPFTDEDDDEYLSVKPNQALKKSPCREKSLLLDLKPKSVDRLFSAQTDARHALMFAWFDGPALLYVLMSLQR